MADQWYYCPKCGFEFPGSEIKSHRHEGFTPWKTDSQTEESNQDEDNDD